MDTAKITENLSGALLQVAKAVPVAIRSSLKEAVIEYPKYLFELLNFFPLDKVDWKAGAYDQYLFDLQKTINDNYEKGNFQVAYFYSHFIFMSYVYYCVEMAYNLQPTRVKDVYYSIKGYNGKNKKPDIEEFNSVYEFSNIPEKEIFKIFYAMKMPHQQICDLSNYIRERNNFAHATGKGNISEDELERNLKTIKGNIVALHTVFESTITSKYIEFLLNKHSLAFAQLNKEFEEFIFDNTFSFADLELLCQMGISGIRNENEEFKKNYRYIKKVHCAFIEYCMDNYAIPEPDGYEALKDKAYLNYKFPKNSGFC